MAVWESLEKYALEYRRQGREDFLEMFDDPVLVIKAAEVTDGSAQTDTETLTGSRIKLAASVTAEDMRQVAAAKGLRILKIAKGTSDPESERITLGRSRTNDMVLTHQTISNVHAYFDILENGRVTVNDGGSRNGTRLNGARLQPDWTTTLENGDKVAFGSVPTTFYSANSFCDFLEIIQKRV